MKTRIPPVSVSRMLAWFAIGLLALLFFLTPLSAAAQTPPRPDQPGGPIPPGPQSEPWVQMGTDDGYTTWRKDVNSGCSFSDHSYSLDVPEEPDNLSDIHYTMSNYDVDYVSSDCSAGPEVDMFYFNNAFIGILTGANNSWSINSWTLSNANMLKDANSVFIDTDATNTGCWCVGVGYIEVRARTGFAVVEETPQPDDKNRAFKANALDLTVTFNNEYDPATVTNTTFKLEYRNAAGAWQSVNGGFSQISPKQFRFTPSADLKDGIRYRATVKSGANGVKSKSGGELKSDEQWNFWTIPDLSLNDAFDYGAGTTCKPSTSPCDGAEINVFQVARNVKMVPGGKPAVTRVSLRWKDHTDVFKDDVLKEMDVTVKSDRGR